MVSETSSVICTGRASGNKRDRIGSNPDLPVCPCPYRGPEVPNAGNQEVPVGRTTDRYVNRMVVVNYATRDCGLLGIAFSSCVKCAFLKRRM